MVEIFSATLRKSHENCQSEEMVKIGEILEFDKKDTPVAEGYAYGAKCNLLYPVYGEVF